MRIARLLDRAVQDIEAADIVPHSCHSAEPLVKLRAVLFGKIVNRTDAKELKVGKHRFANTGEIFEFAEIAH
jgi:hypothetical protein